MIKLQLTYAHYDRYRTFPKLDITAPLLAYPAYLISAAVDKRHGCVVLTSNILHTTFTPNSHLVLRNDNLEDLCGSALMPTNEKLDFHGRRGDHCT